MSDVVSETVWVAIIQPPPLAGVALPAIVVDGFASQAAGAAFVLAYKAQANAAARGIVLPAAKRAMPTMGVDP